MSAATIDEVIEDTSDVKVPDRLECQCDRTLCQICWPCPRPVDGEDMLCKECRQAPPIDRSMSILQRMIKFLGEHHCHPSPKEWAAKNGVG